MPLKEVATAFREELESFALSTLDPLYEDFPRGHCGPVCELFGRYLVEAMGEDALYVVAFKEDQSHAWLEVGSFIVDITADQFQQPAVIVASESEWHEQWERDNDSPPRPPIISPGNWLQYPVHAWKAAITGMAERGFPVHEEAR